jgi:16S rRNA U1498 N3-methylase RsmE
MPKAKPTQVIVHRIELQEKEREMLEPFVKAKEVEQYGKSVAAVGAAAALGVGAYIAWWTTDAVFGWMDKAGDKIDAFKARVDEYDEQSDGQFSENVKRINPLGRLVMAGLGYGF